MSTNARALVLVAVLIGCVEEQQHPIPDGSYHSPSRQEWIAVRESEMDFHVKDADGDSGHVFERSFEYFVERRDGEIITRVMRSADPFFEVGGFFWDGEKIVLKDRRTGETVQTFCREPEPEPEQ